MAPVAPQPLRVAVLGGGVAGCSLVHGLRQLAEAGMQRRLGPGALPAPPPTSPPSFRPCPHTHVSLLVLLSPPPPRLCPGKCMQHLLHC